MLQNPLLYLYLLLFPFFFAAVWIVACWSVAGFSGWRQLARRYRCSSQVIGTTWRSQSAMLGHRFTGSYNNCLALIANDHGLGLSISFFSLSGILPCSFPGRRFSSVKGAAFSSSIEFVSRFSMSHQSRFASHRSWQARFNQPLDRNGLKTSGNRQIANHSNRRGDPTSCNSPRRPL
jgi:hypothetical protein